MSNWTEVVWEWLQSLLEQEDDFAYRSLPQKAPEPGSRADVSTTDPISTPQAIYSAVSLSQWLPAAFESADAANNTAPFEVEQTERSASESFLQGYSLF